MIDYSLDAEYMAYLFEQERQREEMDRFIHECVILSEGTNISNIQTLNEGSLADSLKSTFEKIAAFLRKLWAKFVENMDSLLKKNEDYLKKYKDIILKKPPKGKWAINGGAGSLTRIIARLKYTIPTTGPKSADDMINIAKNGAGAHAKTILKAYRPSLAAGDGSDTVAPGFREYCDLYFKDDSSDDTSKEIYGEDLPMLEMYNYCMEYKTKMAPILEKNIKNITKIYEDVIKNMPNVEKKPDDTQENNESVNNYFNNDMVYSIVYETYIVEADEKDKSSGLKATRIDDDSKDGDKSNKTSDINDRAKSDKEDNEAIKKGLLICQNNYNTVLASQASSAEYMYKFFMNIIKQHVSDYVGKKEEHDNVGFTLKDDGVADTEVDEKEINERNKKKEKEGGFFSNIFKKKKK